MVGQGADRDEVDPRLGIGAECLLGDTAAGLGLKAAANAAHRLAQGVDVEVVEHDAVDAAVVEHTLQLVEVAHLYLDAEILALGGQIVVGAVDGLFYTTGKVDVVVLEHHHVVEANAVVGTAATADSILLQEAHVGGCLAGVEQARVQTVEHGHHTACLRGDTAHALHEVERRALSGEDGGTMAADRHHHIASADAVAVGPQQGDLQGGVHRMEHRRRHFAAAEHAALFGHHLGLAHRVGRNTGQCGVVAVAHVLAQGHSD